MGVFWGIIISFSYPICLRFYNYVKIDKIQLVEIDFMVSDFYHYRVMSLNYMLKMSSFCD